MYRHSANGHAAASLSDSSLMALAAPTVSRRFTRRTRRLVCDDAALAEIGRVAGRAASLDDVRNALGQAAEEATALALSAAGGLRRSRRSAETTKHFVAAFGTRPGYVPTWRPAGARWDRGGVVRARLERAAKIIDGDFIKYYCWGPLSLPQARWHANSLGMTLAGEYRIYLGEGFWRHLRDNGRLSMAATLLRFALHIYFGPQLSHASGPPGFGNISCYVSFLLQANGRVVPEKIAKRCAAAAAAPPVKSLPPVIVKTPTKPARSRNKPSVRKKKRKPTAVVRIILIDPAGIFRKQVKLRTQFATGLEKKFNGLDRAWLKENGFRFRVEYRRGEPTTAEQASFGPLDFPVYLLGRQHGTRTVLNIMKRHKIPKRIGVNKLYDLAKACWGEKAPRGCGIPSGANGYHKVAFIKTHRVFEGAKGSFAQAFVNITAHEIGHMGGLSHSKMKKGLMKYSVHLDKPLHFSALDNLRFRGNLVRLRTFI